jgi:hypothetical protein
MLVLLCGCGLRSSALATRPPGHVRDAGPTPDVASGVTLDAANDPFRPATLPEVAELAIDCQGTEEQVNLCIINAPTKSGTAALRAKPALTYQTCGAQ